MATKITICDFETTGLVQARGCDLIHQPYSTQFYGLQVKETKQKDGSYEYEKIKDFYTLIKPKKPIPGFLEKQIGITNQMVANAPSFLDVWKRIGGVFFGSGVMVAHNLPFDLEILITELKRIGKEHNFPYPPTHYCTVEQSMWVKGHRLKNGELYKIATGKDIENAHDAKADVLATFESFKWLRRQK